MSMQTLAAGFRRSTAAPSAAQAAPQPHHRSVAASAARQRKQQQQQRPQQQQPASKGFGKAPTTQSVPATLEVAQNDELPQQQQPQQQGTAAAAAPPLPPQPDQAQPAAPAVAVGSSSELSAVSRDRIFAVCAQVSFLVAALGFGLRAVAPSISPAVADGKADTVEALLQWGTLPSASQLAVAAAVAVAVTAARAALLAAWPEFREASDKSNKQVLTPLGWGDLLWVGALPAISEELLFRGALIPAAYPDWRGVLIAGLAFGVLHNSGGRNPAFAAWASLVGCAYGALFLATGSVACPALAHSLANIASGALWKAANGGGDGGSKAA